MAKARITEVMMDDASINVSKEVDLVFSIANSLRGAYKSDKYKDVIIPMMIIRRFECALEGTKDKVVKTFEAKRDIPSQILESKSGYQFYNTSRFSLAELLNDADNIVSNFKSYIEGFSANVQSIIRNLDFEKEIDKLYNNNRLLGVVRKFSELDLNPNTIDGIKAGYMFEEIIRRFSENAEAGDHYTPREVIRLLVNVLLAEGLDDLFTERRVATVLDMACGSGGMLSTTYNAINRMNPDAEVRLFGQEINPESYAICLADMLIKGEDAKNIRLQDTMKADCFEGQKMRIVIANPPFGQAWGGKDAADGVESAVKKEHRKADKYEGLEKLGHSRFPWGLPTSGDMQLLFMQHAISKLSKDGRAAIISNGSPLFSGNTSSGESQIRRYMLEHDLIEAIIALPTDLFYNTSIGIYAFILSMNKRLERRGKIQLINAVDMYKPLRKSLGKKRKEISKDDISRITEIYANFVEGPYCKIFDKEEFMYKEYAVYQPLQRRGFLTADAVEGLKTSAYFTANGQIFNEAEYEELIEIDPREYQDEKKFQKFTKGKEFTEAVIAILEKNADGSEYDDFSKFKAHLKELIGDLEGMTDSRLNSIAMELSVIDKSAVVQKDRKGKVLIDPTTKDTEIIGLRLDVEEYFKCEVYPHVPDAIYAYEYDSNKKTTPNNKERLGAEFPFTRYFYEYKAPDKADDLLSEFAEIENGLSKRVASLLGGDL
jgi:type I restriction enzyme M protein